MRRVILTPLILLAVSGCSAQAIPASDLLPKNSIETVSSADVHTRDGTVAVNIQYPPDIATSKDLAPLQKILEGIAEQERAKFSGGFSKEKYINIAFRTASKTIRMVSIEGHVHVLDGETNHFHFRDFVYDSRDIRMVSLGEMFESGWPAAEEAMTNFIADEILAQKKTSASREDVAAFVQKEISGHPQWVLLPAPGNRVASGIRFDIAYEKPLTSTVQIEVPLSVFKEYITPGWKERFTR